MERAVPRFQTDCAKQPSMTVQSAKKECDINNIVAKYQKTGAIEHANRYEPQYGEVTSVTFQDAMNQVTSAQQMFDDLPSSIRQRFEGDPGAFLDFVADPSNAEEMAELGLVPGSPNPPEPPSRRVAEPESPGSAEPETAPETPQ